MTRLSTVTLLCLAASGCADPCEDLQPVCDVCIDPNHKAACERSVDQGVADVCQIDLDYFDSVCR